MHGKLRALAAVVAAALLLVGGCRSTKTDRIRVLEAERGQLLRENDRLEDQLADSRARQLAAETEAERRKAELEARAAGGQAHAVATAPQPAAVVDRSALREQLRDSGVQVKDRADGGAALVLASDVTFQPGRADLNKKSLAVLKRVAGALKDTSGVADVRIEGHTDSDPIRKSGWSSNEELSRARAEMVRKYLVAQGVADRALTVEGLGAARPVAPNDTADNKAKNRRVEIILLPR